MAQTIIVEVIRTTERGAKLVTDGTRAAWVMGRMVREDNSLTAGGIQALAESKMTDADARDYDAYITRQREEREAAREAERQAWKEESNRKVTILIPAENWFGEQGRAYKVWNGNYTISRYKQTIRDYIYLPQSQVEAAETANGVSITAPKWVVNRSNYLTSLMESQEVVPA